MECMEAKALKKSSFSTELIPMNVSNQQGTEDFWCVTGMGCDEFSVDEFFDLPNDEIHDQDNGGFFEEEEDEEKCSNSSLSPSLNDHVDDFPTFSSSFSTHLAIPDDDMQELELWSHLMDDSVPQPTLACPKPVTDAHSKKTGFTFVNRIEPGSKRTMAIASFVTSVVPVKPRTKRSRTTGNRTWFMGSPPKTESSSSSSSFSLPSPVSTLSFAPPVHGMGMYFTYGKPPMKKAKKKPASSVNFETGSNPPVQRRCSHCQVTRTPQWRAGPNGPKTLCNACGVRFKSGRLFPEYRPACSPTFSSEVHSNSHRKVIEMRRKKEMAETESVTDSTPAV